MFNHDTMKSIRRVIKYIRDYVFNPRLSEAALLQREFGERNLKEPGWDEQAHRAALYAGLEDGADHDHLVRLYGQEAVDEESARISEH